MRSFYTAALCLALIHSSTARVPHCFRDLIDRDPEPEPEQQPQHGLLHWISNLFKRAAQTSSTTSSSTNSSSSNETCYKDAYWTFASNYEGFCEVFIETPNVTVTVDYTPSTTTTVFTTYVFTAEDLTRITPLSTLTVTETPSPSRVKRGMAQAEIDDVFRAFRRQNAADASTLSAAALSTSFSSACSCQNITGSTVTATYTDEPVTTTLSAFLRTTTTSTRTTTAAVDVVSTTTLTETPSSTSSSTDSTSTESTGESSTTPATTTTTQSAEATPTSPAYTCPDHNNTVVSQMVGNERFDYLVLCDTVLMDDDLYSGPLNYATFGQCASACSVANANFSEAVCRGVSYYAIGSNSGRCHLKSASESRTSADGVDSAILQQVLMGISPNSTAGTTTESAPFATPTITENPDQMSSMISNILSNSSNAMPMITPGPIVQSGMLVNAPGAQYSTLVTGGSTFSSGTAYSFSMQYSDGSWYYTYFSSFTQAWTSATTIFAAGDNGYEAQNYTTNQYAEQSGDNGDYSIIQNSTAHQLGGGWDNATTTISNVTYNAQNSQIASTATTYTNNVYTGGAASGGPTALPGSSVSGGANGGNNGGGSGGPGSGSPVTTTSTFSTETVIINSGGTNGVTSTQGSGGPGATPTPAPSATTIVNTYGTAGSSGFAASGGGSGTGGATSTAASGGPSPSTSVVTVILSTGGTNGVTGTAAPGGPSPSTSEISVILSTGGTGGVSSFETSGGPSGTLIPISSSVNSDASSGFTQGAGSGGPNATEGATSTQASGGPAPTSSTTTDTFGIGQAPRSGTISRSSTPSGSAPLGTGSVPTTESPSGTAPLSVTGPIPTFNSTGGFYTGPSPSSSTTDTDTFTNGLGSRTGYYSRSTTPSGTAPLSTGPSETTPVSSTEVPGTSPSGTAPSGYTPPGTGTAPTGTAPLSTGPLLSTGTAPRSSSSGSFGDTGAPRVPYSTTTLTGTAPSGYLAPGTPPSGTGTAPSGYAPPGTYVPGIATAPPPLSTAPYTCSNITMGTTTIFSTTTVYGCYDVCPPAGTGYNAGGSPLAFGGGAGGPPLGPPGGRHFAGVAA